MRHLDQVEWGRLIGRFEAERDVQHRLAEDHETRITKLEKTASIYTTWVQRGGLLALLWAGALGLNMSTEQKAEAVSLILKQLAR